MSKTSVWERHYSKLKRLPEWLKKPVPFVVETLHAFNSHKFRDVLDLGCGVGRHCVYLAENGFEVVGLDVSVSALRTAKEWIRKKKLANVNFLRGSMTDLPLGDNCFDAVICVSVLHHAIKGQILRAVDEIHRVLRGNGLFLTNLVSVEDYRYGKGKEVEADTFTVLEDFEDSRFEELHHFFTREEVLQLLARFSRIDVKPLVGGREHQPHHYWKIKAVK
ncbi:MAG: class I SAM-dependent methyltransferase [Candidatus Bathyarchaeota archaeon]|nr:class I SAM-dependent methyltransferase [Candidatus Bathyarchaeota archaeon]